jgi:hypothetical protein
MAPHQRSVSDLGIRVHAAADPGLQGGAVLPPLPGAVSHNRGACPCSIIGGAGELARLGLLSASGEPAPAGAGSSAESGWRDPGRSGGPTVVAGCRPLHGGCGREFCLRARHTGGGHQREPGPATSLPPAFAGAIPRSSGVADRGTDRASSRSDCVGLQPGDHGVGGADLHGPGGAVWEVSSAGCL